MPPRYPFSHSKPSASSSAYNDPNRTPRADDRPIVVSASGVAPNSPAAALTADSPSTLRSRIPSPRNPLAGFSNDSSSYPSPSAVLQQGKSRLISLGKKKKTKSQGGGKGWMRIDTESPTKDNVPINGNPNGRAGPSSAGLNIPRFDSRGYPARDARGGVSPVSPGSSHSAHSHSEERRGLTVSVSHDSLDSSSSSTMAGVDGESGRYLTTDRYAGTNSYPPVMSYSTASPSYSPYDPTPSYHSHSNGQGSVYAESTFSMQSESSMTHFRKYDSVKADYEALSITSKGGQRHLADMFHLPADPSSWSYMGPEADDDFHDPDVRAKQRGRFLGMTSRGIMNIGCLVFLFLLLFMLFGGYPVLTYYLSKDRQKTNGAFNLGGINSTGQIPDFGPFQLIDKDTPQSAYKHTSLETGEEWELIFSDEFNNDGRTFYDGDDPYWQAVDLHYWPTNNLEWYDPRMITTKGGKLVITLDKITYNNLKYMGGMMSTWNRFCFTGGYVEASVSLPGKSTVYGLWPAIWTMGNLGRAGYGGTTEGLWPYSYDSCDVGTLPNQTLNGLPEVTTTRGDPKYDMALSYLPGQRLSRCTCPSDTTHPGPVLPNGTFVGRSAPEIDMFEATVNSDTLVGEVSLSGQWAPFNPDYSFVNTSKKYYEIYDTANVELNSYQGGVYQQATSALGVTNQNCYVQDTNCFSVYGFEYSPTSDQGYITWVSNDKKAWTVRSAAMGPNSEAKVGQRLVSEEPMYLIANLGISENFGAVDYTGLADLWPVHMEVDYIRVYQDPSKRNIGCDPANMPTSKYIAQYPDAYNNPNITTFAQIPNSVKPKNSLVDTC